MGSEIEWSKREIAYVIRSYKAGASANDLAAEYGVSIPVIYRVLRNAKVKMRGPGRVAGKTY